MKLRFGFVSNSSSSSFIVAFPKIPESASELQLLLFGSKSGANNPYEEFEHHSAESLAATLFSVIDLPLTTEQMREEVDNGYFDASDGAPQYPSNSWNDSERMERYRREFFAFTSAKFKQFMEDTAGSVYFKFEVGDNHGDIMGPVGTTLENGDAFNGLPHIRCNKH